MRRRIAIITVSRADWGPLRPVARAARDDPHVEPVIIATGAHLDPAQGRTAAEIELDGFAIDAAAPVRAGQPMAECMADVTEGVARALRTLEPDLALVLGDRYETLAAAGAAVAEGIPLAHLHGGEITTGAIDNRFRGAITALADLHLVATPGARDRLLSRGAPASRVIRVGAPGLDHALADPAPPDPPAPAGARDRPFALVTVHPETAGRAPPRALAEAVAAALDQTGLPAVITGANADPGGDHINDVWRARTQGRRDATFEMSLGAERYRAAMRTAAVMVGNSSSGIIEAASFGLRVVNVGDRQAGRERSGNVEDVPADAGSIAHAIDRAVNAGPYDGPNVYGEGDASPRIVRVLRDLALEEPSAVPGPR